LVETSLAGRCGGLLGIQGYDADRLALAVVSAAHRRNLCEHATVPPHVTLEAAHPIESDGQGDGTGITEASRR